MRAKLWNPTVWIAGSMFVRGRGFSRKKKDRKKLFSVEGDCGLISKKLRVFSTKLPWLVGLTWSLPTWAPHDGWQLGGFHYSAMDCGGWLRSHVYSELVTSFKRYMIRSINLRMDNCSDLGRLWSARIGVGTIMQWLTKAWAHQNFMRATFLAMICFGKSTGTYRGAQQTCLGYRYW